MKRYAREYQWPRRAGDAGQRESARSWSQRVFPLVSPLPDVAACTVYILSAVFSRSQMEWDFRGFQGEVNTWASSASRLYH